VKHAALGLALALLAACGGSSPEGSGTASSASASAGMAAPQVAAASASAPPAASAEGGGADGPPIEGAPPAGTYAGAYKAKVGSMNEVPKDAKTKVWSSDAGTEALGDGTLSLTVVSGKRAVSGEAKGPLGDQLINGELDGKTLRARIDPADPNEAAAMTGILNGSFEADGFKGVLRVAGRNGNLVREGAVTLKKK
jgi:hypothetical protein